MWTPSRNGWSDPLASQENPVSRIEIPHWKVHHCFKSSLTPVDFNFYTTESLIKLSTEKLFYLMHFFLKQYFIKVKENQWIVWNCEFLKDEIIRTDRLGPVHNLFFCWFSFFRRYREWCGEIFRTVIRIAKSCTGKQLCIA